MTKKLALLINLHNSFSLIQNLLTAPTKNDRDGVKETFEYGIETFLHQNDDSFFSHAPKILSEQECAHIPNTDIFQTNFAYDTTFFNPT